MGVELDRATAADFAPHIDQPFAVDGTKITLHLADVHALGENPGGAPRRAPFRLMFRGPFEPILPQRIYRLTNEALGDIEIFIVPIGPDETGQRYEAVFN